MFFGLKLSHRAKVCRSSAGRFRKVRKALAKLQGVFARCERLLQVCGKVSYGAKVPRQSARDKCREKFWKGKENYIKNLLVFFNSIFI